MATKKKAKETESKRVSPILPNPLEIAKWALEKVVDRAEETSNCGVCGEEMDEHAENCPYPEAVEFLQRIGVR